MPYITDFNDIAFYFILISFFSIFSYYCYNSLVFFKNKTHLFPIEIPINFYIFINAYIYFSLSMGFIIYSYINSDFSLINIVKHSNVLEPILYKFTGLWGNQDGSLLLWLFILFSYFFIIIVLTKYDKLKFFYKVINIQNMHILFFLFFLIFFCNPFLKNLYFIKNGYQLNPILQDPTLAIHPPFLYLGYLGSSILFSLGFFILQVKIFPNYMLYYLKIFTFITWLTLTFGIGLGSWWAYYELGWGGWWFWDPVENISLIPWLLTIALLHNLLLNSKNNTSIHLTLLLLNFTYIFTIFGTYIVRSGILTSVHSFAQDESNSKYIYFYLISLLLFITFYIINNYLKLVIYKSFNIFSKEYFIKYFIYISLVITTIIIITLILPIIINLLISKEISFTTNFYNDLLAPSLIPIILFMIIGILSPWNHKFSLKILPNYIYIITLLIYLFFYLIINVENYYLMIILITLLIWALMNMLIISIKYKLINSMIIAHLAILSFLLSMIINLYFQHDATYMIRPGEHIYFEGYNFYFRNIHFFEMNNYRNLFFDLIIEKMDQFLLIIFPEQRFFLENKLLTFKPNVHSNLLSDIYIILGDGNNYIGWYIKLILNPMINIMWCSILLLVYAGIRAIHHLLQKRKQSYNFYQIK